MSDHVPISETYSVFEVNNESVLDLSDITYMRVVHGATSSKYLQGDRSAGFGVGKGMVMIGQVVAAGGGHYVKLMAWQLQTAA